MESLVLWLGVVLALLAILTAVYFYVKALYPSYVELKGILDNVSGNGKNYMNFGLWDGGSKTLEDSNERLCDLVADRSDFPSAKRVLDVGFGHGEQITRWNKKNKDMVILGIELEEAHVRAGEALVESGALGTNVSFLRGDACDLPCKDSSFDRVVSVESAFHYDPREKFFREASRVLSPGGKLVIADIVRDNEGGLCSDLAGLVASHFLSAPLCNAITVDKWVEQLEASGFEVEWEDITERTFVPYLAYMRNNLSLSNSGLQWLACSSVSIWETICARFRPFRYVVAVCAKSGK
jgi:erythromycin 3''-O-methyltransferase